MCKCLVSYSTNISNYHPLEVVGRGSETQLQVGENLNYLIKRFCVSVGQLYTNTGSTFVSAKTLNEFWVNVDPRRCANIKSTLAERVVNQHGLLKHGIHGEHVTCESHARLFVQFRVIDI